MATPVQRPSSDPSGFQHSPAEARCGVSDCSTPNAYSPELTRRLSYLNREGRRLPPTNDEFLRCLHMAMAHYRNLQSSSDRAIHDTAVDDTSRVLRPRVHLYESKALNRVIATIEVPGLRKSEVRIVASECELLIRGERRPLRFRDEFGRTVINELKFGRFERAIPIPRGTESSQISASMNDGMLTVSWPLHPSINECDE